MENIHLLKRLLVTCGVCLSLLWFGDAQLNPKVPDPSKIYKVTSIVHSLCDQEAPFLMEMDGEPGKYIGYIPDLLAEMAKRMDMKYEINLVKDGRFGSLQANGEWNGMIGELVRQEADIAAAPLTITRKREVEVDFSKPFMIMGIGLMMNKNDVIGPVSGGTSKLSAMFLRPFSVGGWFIIIIISIGVYLMAFLIARSHPQKEGQTRPPASLSLRAAFLCKVAGANNRPVALVVLFIFWCCFCIMLLSMYTAGLVATVNQENVEETGSKLRFRTLEEVVNSDIPLGSLKDTSTPETFEASQQQLHEQIHLKLAQNPHNLVPSMDDAVKRIMKGNFAFLTETKPMEYQLVRHCDLVQVGKAFDHKAYGFATQKNSDISDKLSVVILKLLENQFLLQLEAKWFRSNDLQPCPKIDILPEKEETQKKPVNEVVTRYVECLTGPFAFMLFGVGLAWIFTMIAVCRKYRRG